MKQILMVLIMFSLLFFADQVWGSENASYANAGVLTSGEAATLAYMWEDEKHLRDIYINGSECSDYPQLDGAELVEQAHMNILKELLYHYGLNTPVPNETVGVFSNSFWQTRPVWMGWGYVCLNPNYPISIFRQSAYFEELNIWYLLRAMAETDKQDLIDVYSYLLADSCDHLQRSVFYLRDNSLDHSPEYLSQDEFDAILAGTFPTSSGGGFTINPGLNDAWYNPETSGQGFFISVFPDLGAVTLAWFTYDTEQPPTGAIASLGDASHRWLTAVGSIEGNQVNMEIEMTSGGLFDTATVVERTDPPGSDGTIILTFSSCNSGTVEYDIPSINRQGTVPIQRVVTDNIVLCEALLAD